MAADYRKSKLYDKVLACLLGGVIGDAMGAPAEDLTYDEIRSKYGTIEDFAGEGTDDSAIKRVLCKAIVDYKGHITADEFAQTFLDNVPERFYIPVQNAYHKLVLGLALPVYAGMGNMASSSSAMCISPLGIINACNPRQAAMEAFDVGGMMHGVEATFCREGASAMAAAVAEALREGSTVESVLEASTKYLHPTSGKEMIEAIHKGLELAKTGKSYEKFRELFYGSMLRPSIVSDSRETVPCALALFFLANGHAETAIIYGANFGRDADTIASMVGALSAAFGGMNSLRPLWREKILKQNPSQRELADDLCRVVDGKLAEMKSSLEQASSLLA